MNERIGASAPSWLRIVALLALLWNLFGVYTYLVSVGAVPGEPVEQAGQLPAWVTGAYALSVFAGALGSLGLLLLRSWAYPLLLLSLVAILAQVLWAFVLNEGPRPDFVLPLAITVVGLLVAWLARTARTRGWLV